MVADQGSRCQFSLGVYSHPECVVSGGTFIPISSIEMVALESQTMLRGVAVPCQLHQLIIFVIQMLITKAEREYFSVSMFCTHSEAQLEFQGNLHAVTGFNG